MKIFAVPGTVGGKDQGESAQSEEQFFREGYLSTMDAVKQKVLGEWET